MDEPNYYAQKSRGFDMLLNAAPYVVGAIAINKLGQNLGLWDSTKTKKGAEAFRKLPFLRPQFVTEVFKSDNIMAILSAIFTPNDLYMFDKWKKGINDVYYSKGYVWDNEASAINSLKATIRSKIDFSLYAIAFETLIKEDLLTYLDTFLEDSYQAELYEWAKKLPLLSIKEVDTLQKNFKRQVKLVEKKNKILLGKKL